MLTTNDEARFPVMARDILSHGHWLFPETSGVPMLNKPPLHAWLIALAGWPTGVVSQRVAALPSWLGALGVVAVTCWIARRLFGADAGLAAALIVATTAGMFAMARSAVPDMTLSFGIVAAMAAFVAAELDGSRGAWVGFYALVAMAFWAKGPAGLLPIVIVIVYEWAIRGWRGLVRMRPGVGAVIVVPLVAGWSRSRRVGRDTMTVVAACAVAAGILIVGDASRLTRDNRSTEWRTMARALERAPAPLFALDAPELVFAFYLDRPIKAISSAAELNGIDPPFYVIARSPPEAASFAAASEGLVNGRRFVLWAKR